jgi:NADPH:quinone reductase-like Zn-dependent oxidoreductase
LPTPWVRTLGADHVVDYTSTDVADSGRHYDRILDTVGNRSVHDLRRALAEGGKAAVTGFTSVERLISVSLRGGKEIPWFRRTSPPATWTCCRS